jgi:ribosomal protein L16 Arg81 hydroxylase
MPTLSLDDLLSPLPAGEFIKDYWGQKFLHMPGEPGRFSSLFPWPILNQMLETHRFVPPRLRLVHEGKSVPSDLFMKSGHLRAPEMTGLLRDGATLIIDGVDEVYAPLKALSQHLSRKLQARINVNMYAGWRTTHGFDVHWDTHDVFILQVAGKKLWKVYQPTEKFPVKTSVELGKTPPDAPPIWDRLLNDGEVLYLPRGWWHVAIPCDEPTLHLTVGIHKPTGLDVVRWVNEDLQNDERLRMDIPLLADDATNASYVKAIQDSVREAFERPDLLLRFKEQSSVTALNRPYFGLPFSVTSEVMPASEASVIVLVPSQGLDVRSRADGAVDVLFNGKQFTFAGPAMPLLGFLAEKLPASISAFYQRFANQFERETLRQFLTEMAKQGVVVIREQ